MNQAAVEALTKLRDELKQIEPWPWANVIEWIARAQPMIAAHFKTDLETFKSFAAPDWHRPIAFTINKFTGEVLDDEAMQARYDTKNRPIAVKSHAQLLSCLDGIISAASIAHFDGVNASASARTPEAAATTRSTTSQNLTVNINNNSVATNNVHQPTGEQADYKAVKAGPEGLSRWSKLGGWLSTNIIDKAIGTAVGVVVAAPLTLWMNAKLNQPTVTPSDDNRATGQRAALAPADEPDTISGASNVRRRHVTSELGLSLLSSVPKDLPVAIVVAAPNGVSWSWGHDEYDEAFAFASELRAFFTSKGYMIKINVIHATTETPYGYKIDIKPNEYRTVIVGKNAAWEHGAP